MIAWLIKDYPRYKYMSVTKKADRLAVSINGVLIVGYGENIEYRVKPVNNQYFFKAEKIVVNKKDALACSVYESRDILKIKFNFYSGVVPVLSECLISGYANVVDDEKVYDFYSVVGNAKFINISNIAI